MIRLRGVGKRAVYGLGLMGPGPGIMLMRACKSALLILLLSALAPAQDDRDEPIRLRSDLVTVTASVRDGGNRPIKSLKASDFAIYEDGVRQKIDHFGTAEVPFALMLLLDISGSTTGDIELIKRAAKSFVSQLRPDDRVGVIVFGGEVEMISEFDDGRARVEAAIDSIAPVMGTGEYRFTSKTGTSFYDALFLAVEDSPLKKIEGRKAIVCLSDGVDSRSKLAYKDISPLVEKSEASFYFLNLNTEQATLEGLLKPRTDPGYVNFSQSQIDRYYAAVDPNSPERFRPREAISPLMKREINAWLYENASREEREMAERTGGRVYPVNALTDLDAVYKQVADELRSQYSISYYPINDAHDGRWRKIKVDVRHPGATVRARSGYRAPGN